MDVISAGVPFGGYKDSGSGREKSEYALRSFTQVKVAAIGCRRLAAASIKV